MKSSSKQPLVSVIMPTYNHARFIGRAIESVLNQTYQNIELIIIDNYSEDDTERIVSSYKDDRIKYFKFRNNGIIAASRNYGIKHAQGEYIAFLDSDDWWILKKLEIAVQYLEQGYDVCFHGLWGVRHEKWQIFKKPMKGRPVSYPVYDDILNNHPEMPNSSIVVRTVLLRQIGGESEDPDLIAAEDYECLLRISKVTERFVYIPIVLGFYWMEGHEHISNAKRSLVNLKRLASLYITPYIKEHHSSFPIWWQYSFSRAMYLTGEKAEARRILKQLRKRSLPWFMLLKVYFMLVMTWEYKRIK